MKGIQVVLLVLMVGTLAVGWSVWGVDASSSSRQAAQADEAVASGKAEYNYHHAQSSQPECVAPTDPPGDADQEDETDVVEGNDASGGGGGGGGGQAQTLGMPAELNHDLSRTLKSEKVTKDNAINDFLQAVRSHLTDTVSVKYIVLGNVAAGNTLLSFQPLTPNPG